MHCDLFSNNDTFFEDFETLGDGLCVCLNDFSPEVKDSILESYKQELLHFQQSLELLEVHAIFAAFVDKEGNIMVDLFKKWNRVTKKYENNSYTDFLEIIMGRYYLGYYYKFAYMILIMKEDIDFNYLHFDLSNESINIPPLELFRKKSVTDMLQVNILLYKS
jgi:hypothetical protein